MQIVVYQETWTDEDGTARSRWVASHVVQHVIAEGSTADVALRRLVAWLKRAEDDNDETTPWIDGVRLAPPFDPEEEQPVPCADIPLGGVMVRVADIAATQAKALASISTLDPKAGPERVKAAAALGARLVWAEPVALLPVTPADVVMRWDAGQPYAGTETIPDGWTVRMGA
jgi:hypothetical protein